MIKFMIFLVTFLSLFSITVFADRSDMATYRLPVEDYGIVLEPSKPGEAYYQYDGYGVREGIINKVENTYYMFYDGAAAHLGTCSKNDPERHLWRGMLAKSTDLIHWEKLGVRLWTSFDEHPDSSAEVYKDYWSASSPWAYYNDQENFWYLFYLGAEGAAPGGDDVGTPATYYNTCIAKAKTSGIYGIEGEWQKLNDLQGQEKAVALYQKPVTCSPGSVIQNPRWKPGDTVNKRYMMFITRGDQIQIARSNTLDGVHNWDKTPNANGWNFDSQILDKTKKTAPENATIYFDEKTGWYFLFTNQFSLSRTYCDSNIVYWTKDPNVWDAKKCAAIIDKATTKNKWATGAIGMPSVVKVNDDTLAVMYDASLGGLINHTNRRIALSYWKIPNLDENGVPIGYVKPSKPVEPYFVNDDDAKIKYVGDFTHQNDPGGDVHFTNTTGNYFEFTFMGTRVKWIGEKAFNRGTAEIFIDGQSKGVINQYDANVLYKQELYSIDNLPYGEHTIKIVCLQNKYIDVDAFEIDDPSFPAPSPSSESAVEVNKSQKEVNKSPTYMKTFITVAIVFFVFITGVVAFILIRKSRGRLL